MVPQVAIPGAGQGAHLHGEGWSATGMRPLSVVTDVSWDPGHDLGGDFDGGPGMPKERGWGLICIWHLSCAQHEVCPCGPCSKSVLP